MPRGIDGHTACRIPFDTRKVICGWATPDTWTASKDRCKNCLPVKDVNAALIKEKGWPMKERVIIYHGPGCADGFCAAWIAHHKFGDGAEYVPAQYGDAPPDVTDRDVLVLDFSYPRETLERMATIARTMLVLDHHKTAESDCHGLPFCRFDMQKSGATLAWEALAEEGENVPALVRYVEDRDLWRFRLKDSREINAWIGTLPASFAVWDQAWETMQADFGHTVDAGRALIRQVEKYVEAVRAHAIWYIIAGRNVPVVNAAAPFTSELVGALAESAPFAVSWWQRGDGVYQYSLRARGSSDVDVGEIAKTFGGGGHRQAAGFAGGPPGVLFTRPNEMPRAT